MKPVLALLLLVAVPAQAQYGATQPLYGPTVNDPSSNTSATILRVRDRRAQQAQDPTLARKRTGAISAGDPTPTELPEAPTKAPVYLDTVPPNEGQNPAPKVFPDHRALKKKIEEVEAASPPPPAPPPPPEGLRGVSLEGLLENDSVLALMAKSRRDDVRRLLDKLVADKQVLDEGSMVARVARALGALVPDGPGEVEQVAHQVPLERADAGDVLLFELKGRKHAAVFYGEGRFAWSGRTGVSFASLDRLPWPGKLVAVLRMPSP